jgi:hypothetical protein
LSSVILRNFFEVLMGALSGSHPKRILSGQNRLFGDAPEADPQPPRCFAANVPVMPRHLHILVVLLARLDVMSRPVINQPALMALCRCPQNPVLTTVVDATFQLPISH